MGQDDHVKSMQETHGELLYGRKILITAATPKSKPYEQRGMTKKRGKYLKPQEERYLF